VRISSHHIGFGLGFDAPRCGLGFAFDAAALGRGGGRTWFRGDIFGTSSWFGDAA